MLSVGDAAPVFDLVDQHGRSVTLESLRGRRLMFVFLPLAFSGICASELEQLVEDQPLFASARTEVIGISVDSMFALRTWTDAIGAPFRLLSDFWPHGAVADRFHAFDAETGRATRTSIAIDERGTVVSVFSTPADRARTTAMYAQALSMFEDVE
ncbi:redoxin domain-containing protein [Paramicrobacterium fandaimingii]|uniref:redoxin domain-containing protein n=1 Tax=Paramicrobacterium fandaimingii TaxID=2708079 RepID=UPI00141E78EB|nr:redoxin domain-containing protein [Microbacterium fandaimingii]